MWKARPGKLQAAGSLLQRHGDPPRPPGPMSEEDDWFERALRELDDESADSDEVLERATQWRDGDEDGEDDDRSDEAGRVDDGEGSGNGDRSGTDDRERAGDDGDGSSDPVGSRPDPESGSDVAAGSFGDDDPFGGSAGPVGDDDPFGGSAGSFGDDDPFGGSTGSVGGGSFGGDDPVGGSAGPPDDDGGGNGAPTGFDEDAMDEFETDIDRTDIGIEGLDEMILGGIPSRSLLTVIGGPGTGKTTFGLQFLNETLESGGRGVYITLEQSRESILSTAEEKGWPFREHVDADRLAVASLDPIQMANSLASIRNDLTRLIASFGADRLVLDSVSLLEMMYDHPAKRRSEVFGFTRLLKEAGVTTLLTSEASDESAYASRYGLVEYLTDGVVVLQYIRGSDFRETRLAVEIQKIRDANHSRETKPYEITDEGISVYRQANIF